MFGPDVLGVSVVAPRLRCQSQEGRSLPVLTADFSRELCDEFSPQYQFLAVVPGQAVGFGCSV